MGGDIGDGFGSSGSPSSDIGAIGRGHGRGVTTGQSIGNGFCSSAVIVGVAAFRSDVDGDVFVGRVIGCRNIFDVGHGAIGFRIGNPPFNGDGVGVDRVGACSSAAGAISTSSVATRD